MRKFIPGQPIEAKDLNEIVSAINFWGSTIDAQKNFLLNVAGIECIGDINVGGTFKIKGVPITAFRTPRPVVRQTGVASLNNMDGDIELTSGNNIQITRDGKRLTINSAVPAVHHNWMLEAGDNIALEKTGDTLKVNADPGDWEEYTPRVVDETGNLVVNQALGQFIVWGPICHLQLSINTEYEGPIRAALPIAAYGNVRQSLDGYELIGTYIMINSSARDYRIGGSYRIA